MTRYTLQIVSRKSTLGNFIVWNILRIISMFPNKKSDGRQLFDRWLRTISTLDHPLSGRYRTSDRASELHNVDFLMYCVSLRIDMYSKYGVSFEGTHEAWEIPSSETTKCGCLYWACPEHLWSCESRAKNTGSSWMSGKKSLLIF